VIVAVLVLLAGAAACKKEKKDQAGGGGGAAAPASNELRGMLAMIPVQSDGVVGVDLAKLRSSDLYRAYQKDIEAAAARELQEFKALCGFDPVPKLQKVVAGGSGDVTGAGTIVVKGFSKAETMACLSKAAGAAHDDVRITVDGDFATIETLESAPVDVVPPATPPAAAATAAAPPPTPAAPRVADSVSVQFLDDTTAVVARRGGKAVDKTAMQAILASKPGDTGNVTGSTAFMEMIDAVDTDAALWFVVNGKADAVQKAGRGFLSFDAAFGHVRVGSGVNVDVNLRLESDDAAKNFADMAQRQVESMRKSLMKDMIGATKVEQHGRDVHFTVAESREQLEKLIDFASTFLGSFFGQ